MARRLGAFDTLLMLGNNFGLCSHFKRARWLLRRFRSMTSDGALIIAETFDPYATQEPHHLACQRRNRKRGRMGGQVRLRIRYRRDATPFYDYLFVSKDELRPVEPRVLKGRETK